jgi:hypothetical protein
MTNQHPITPPPELVKQWMRTAPHPSNEHEHYHYITLCAAQWGADMELEACCEWTAIVGGADALRAARRRKPPSLKEQALERCNDYIDPDGIIRRALEAQ